MEIPLTDVLSRVTPTPVEEDGIQLPIVAGTRYGAQRQYDIDEHLFIQPHPKGITGNVFTSWHI